MASKWGVRWAHIMVPGGVAIKQEPEDGMWTTMRFAAMTLLAALAVGAPSAHADSDLPGDCGNSYRTYHGDAECLEGWWRNSRWPDRPTTSYSARNLCSEYGKVVAKIDRKGIVDTQWTLKNGDKKTGGSTAKVQNIWCCTDLSDLCNKSDITGKKCKDFWEDSEAKDSCSYPSGWYIKVKEKKCALRVQCADPWGGITSMKLL